MNSTADFKQTVVINTLRSCPLFAGLPATDIQAIAKMSVIKRLAKGQTLFSEGAPVHGFFIVQTGAIKLCKFGGPGHEHVIHVFRPHEAFAEDMLLSSSGHTADAYATENTQVLMLPKAPFLALLKDRSELSVRLLWAVSQHVQQLIKFLQDLTCKDVQTRLGDWLLQHCPDAASATPQKIKLPMTKRVLASELGICGETLSRTLTKFRQRHFLAVDGRTIILFSPTRFSEWLHKPADRVATARVA
jgi:CRP-like cAMP-binding protein